MGNYTSLTLLVATVGDLLGGWSSDYVAKRTGNLKLARRGLAMAGFLIAAVGILLATVTQNPVASVYYTCLALFGLEMTVGISWAIPLDIGSDYAGSVSAVMNTCGNIGGAISPTLLAYLVEGYGWDAPFLLACVLCASSALLWTRIDATRQIFVAGGSE
jgi:MFS family permease